MQIKTSSFVFSDNSFLDNKPHWYPLNEHDENNCAELHQPRTLSPTHSSSSSASQGGGMGGGMGAGGVGGGTGGGAEKRSRSADRSGSSRFESSPTRSVNKVIFQ